MKKTLILFTPFLFFVAGYILGAFREHEVRFNEIPSVEVVSVYDGDTITVEIKEWPDIIGHRIGVRIKGIDTPEMRDERESVQEKARQAKMFVVEKLRNAKTIKIQNLERDKYFRIDADVFVDGQNLSTLLLSKGLAKKYDGGKKPKWN